MLLSLSAVRDPLSDHCNLQTVLLKSYQPKGLARRRRGDLFERWPLRNFEFCMLCVEWKKEDSSSIAEWMRKETVPLEGLRGIKGGLFLLMLQFKRTSLKYFYQLPYKLSIPNRHPKIWQISILSVHSQSKFFEFI